MKRYQSKLSSLLVLAAALGAGLLVSFAHAAPPLPGAIFTTTANGGIVNANHYQNKCDVYLDGGPGPNAPQGAAGLPDGDYFFQVTDPSGKTLLSTDPVKNRQFRVTAGIISGLSGAGNHVTGVDIDHGAVTIQLCNYLDTPNNGGVYKVWVTPIGDFVGDINLVDNPCGNGCFHGFIPAASKTDNYKVAGRGRQPCLTIGKFLDANHNGKLDSGEPQLVWPVTVIGPLGDNLNGVIFTGTTTSKLPNLEICNLASGTYRVTEGATNDPAIEFEVTANILDNKALTPPSRDVLVPIKSVDRTFLFGNAEVKK